MLANGRPEMVKRAIQSFKAQTLPQQQRHLLIFDTGVEPLYDLAARGTFAADPSDYTISYSYSVLCEGFSIGKLRNLANALTLPSWDCLAHWDSDDWSHPQRLMEQLTLLEMGGKECVGYNELVFWETVQLTEKDVYGEREGTDAPCDVIERAWVWQDLDNRKPIGTSLCYRRKAWERVKFLDGPTKAGATSEYYNWLKQVDSLAVSSLLEFHGEAEKRPRMIASIHGKNTQYYDPTDYVAHNRGTSWRRAKEWDKACSEIMSL